MIWFAAASPRLREREERATRTIALMAGAVLLGTAIFMRRRPGRAGQRPHRACIALTVGVFQATMVLNAMIGLAAAVPLTAAGMVLRTRMLPDWLGYVALAAAVISGITALTIFATSGSFVPGGSYLPIVTLVAGGIFVLSASGYMAREHPPSAVPMGQMRTQ